MPLSLTEILAMSRITQPLPESGLRPGDQLTDTALSFVRRYRRSRRWVCRVAGRWQACRPRQDWFASSITACPATWSTFFLATRAANDPTVEALGVVTDGHIVPVSPAVVRQIAAGDDK